MILSRKSDLVSRLDGYSATLRSSRVDETHRRRSRNWQLYAAVTGSALAMATNASAGIIYSGVQNLEAGPIANSSKANTSVKKTVNLGNSLGVHFLIAAKQHNTQGTRAGGAELLGPPFNFGPASVSNHNFSVKFLDTTSPGIALENLSSKAIVSKGAAGNWNANVGILSYRFQAGPIPGFNFQWASGKTGVAGFSFEAVNRHSNSHKCQTTWTYGPSYYGWIRLKFTDGANGLANSITAIDWAYESDPGVSITAGDDGASSSTPEPSTGALAILAAGAAGVVAIRRKKAA